MYFDNRLLVVGDEYSSVYSKTVQNPIFINSRILSITYERAHYEIQIIQTLFYDPLMFSSWLICRVVRAQKNRFT